MSKDRHIFQFIMLLFMLSACSASADELRIKNGDRLSGEIIRMEREQLFFQTPYSSEMLAISWKEIDCITSERHLRVLFNDDEVLTGAISCPEKGAISIAGELPDGSVKTAMNRLQAINPSTYTGQVSIGGSLNSGNTNSRALNASTRLQAKTQRHRLTVDAKYNYGDTGGKPSARNWSGNLKYDRFLKDKWYGYVQSFTEQDSFANLNLRNTEGLGLGYQFYDGNRFSLFAEGGISYLYEDMRETDDRQDAAGRWSAGMDWEVVPGRLTFFHRQEGYYSFIAQAMVLHTEQGVRIPLFENLHANFQADYRFNSAPSAGVKSSDLGLILGLTYRYAYW